MHENAQNSKKNFMRLHLATPWKELPVSMIHCKQPQSIPAAKGSENEKKEWRKYIYIYI